MNLLKKVFAISGMSLCLFGACMLCADAVSVEVFFDSVAYDCNINDIEAMLNADPSLATLGYSGTTALHEAARSGNTDVIELLIARGAAVNAKGAQGRSSLHMVLDHLAYNGIFSDVNKPIEEMMRVVEVLLENDADTAAKDDFDQTPLERFKWHVENYLIILDDFDGYERDPNYETYKKIWDERLKYLTRLFELAESGYVCNRY